MEARAWPRMAVGVLAAAFALAAARPALACYCIEYCSSTEVGVAPPPEEGPPQPNVYVVAIRWTAYPNAPSDCTYAVSGYPVGVETYVPMSSCTPVTDGNGYVVGLDCVVEAASASGENWVFHIGSGSQINPGAGNECTTAPPIFLPGPLEPPPVETGNPVRSSPGEVTLRWTAPPGRAVTSGSEPIEGYAIYRSSGSQPTPERIAKVAATETSYRDTGLSAAESYTYEIYAVDRYGLGGAAEVRVPATTSGRATGGCNTAGSAMAPLMLALAAAGALWRRRRTRA